MTQRRSKSPTWAADNATCLRCWQVHKIKCFQKALISQNTRVPAAPATAWPCHQALTEFNEEAWQFWFLHIKSLSNISSKTYFRAKYRSQKTWLNLGPPPKVSKTSAQLASRTPPPELGCHIFLRRSIDIKKPTFHPPETRKHDIRLPPRSRQNRYNAFPHSVLLPFSSVTQDGS